MSLTGVLWSLWGAAFAVGDVSESGCAGRRRQDCPPPGCSERFRPVCGGAAQTSSLLHAEGAQAQVDGSTYCRCVCVKISLDTFGCVLTAFDGELNHVNWNFFLQLLRGKWTVCFYWSTWNKVQTSSTAQIHEDSESLHFLDSWFVTFETCYDTTKYKIPAQFIYTKRCARNPTSCYFHGTS